MKLTVEDDEGNVATQSYRIPILARVVLPEPPPLTASHEEASPEEGETAVAEGRPEPPDIPPPPEDVSGQTVPSGPEEEDGGTELAGERPDDLPSDGPTGPPSPGILPYGDEPHPSAGCNFQKQKARDPPFGEPTGLF